MRALWNISAPAKLNLFLHITSRRADGYHELQSVFMLIDWCDTLHFERRADGAITKEVIHEASGEDLCSDMSRASGARAPDAVLANARLPDEDLCVRAAKALQSKSHCKQGVHITLIKRIPMQSGMGGGSSDAASCLLALNRLWDLGLKSGDLMPLGLALGADVPFFLSGRNAWVEGVGERITPIETPEERFIVAKPPQGLSTAEIFASSMLTRNTPCATIVDFVADPYGFGRNDLQPVALDLCQGVAQGLKWLAQNGLEGRMTGSGSAVFARVKADWTHESHDVFEAPGSDWRVKVCRNLPSHPLCGWAGG